MMIRCCKTELTQKHVDEGTLDVLEGYVNTCHTQNNKCMGYGKANCHKADFVYISYTVIPRYLWGYVPEKCCEY
jgi:hypothetical protein